ncbi:putative peptidase M41 [Rosa chinensis]|uniref:Putative peptidase M41 n=1 Tax=Rosa chinensis TaxID=74649 RepID=A0A2P6RKA9_ROSCH|nr:putative peptidase M41 [Rosa chinensis]
MMGTERKSAVKSEELRKLTAFHESCHALVAIHADGALPTHKATIASRGMSLGMVIKNRGRDWNNLFELDNCFTVQSLDLYKDYSLSKLRTNCVIYRIYWIESRYKKQLTISKSIFFDLGSAIDSQSN